MDVDHTKAEQERIEEAFEISLRAYEERRHRERVLEWADYHERRAMSLATTLGGLIDHHRREQRRYQAMLSPQVEGEEQHG